MSATVTTIDDAVLFIDVCEELMDPQWDFRTVEGIAKARLIEPKKVLELLLDHPWLVRWMPVLDEEGHQLLVWSGKKVTWRERKLRIRAYLAKDFA